MRENKGGALIWVLTAVLVFGLGALAVYFSKQEKINDNTSDENIIADVRPNDWVSGKVDAPVTLIEYSDFQCPACASYYPLIEELRVSNADKFRFVYRHFPLAQHRNATIAAIASEAAGRQGKFFEMYNLLFSKQTEWSGDLNPKTKFVAYAGLLGLDAKLFTDDLADDELKKKVQLDYRSGLSLKVNSTPTFFINGVKINNPRNLNEFQTIINNAFASTSQSSTTDSLR